MFRHSMIATMLLGLLLSACSGENQAYVDACAADTPEAYQIYIDQFPEGMHIADVKQRQDDKNFKIAETEDTAAAYEKYLEAHPDGSSAADAREKATTLAWDEADKANTVEAMKAYKAKYGTGSAAIRVDKRLAGLEYAKASIVFEETELERMNISGKKKEEPNGYKLTTKAINNGDKVCDVIKIRIVYTDDKGATMDIKPEYLAIPAHPRGLPLADETKEPFKGGGEEREFEYMFGDDNIKEGWPAGVANIRVEVYEIEFAK